jgi:hypothetical protein
LCLLGQATHDNYRKRTIEEQQQVLHSFFFFVVRRALVITCISFLHFFFFFVDGEMPANAGLTPCALPTSVAAGNEQLLNEGCVVQEEGEGVLDAGCVGLAGGAGVSDRGRGRPGTC